MDQIPEWLLRWLYTKAIDLAFSRFWNSYGRAWLHSGKEELLRLYVWYQVSVTWLVMSLTLVVQQKEPTLAVEETDVEELREAVRHFIPVSDITLFPQFKAGFDIDTLAQFRSNLYTDALAQVRSNIRDSVRVDALAGIRNSMRDSYKADRYAVGAIRSSNVYSVSEAARNMVGMSHDMSLLARTAEEARKSFISNHDVGGLARTAEEVRKSLNTSHLSQFGYRP